MLTKERCPQQSQERFIHPWFILSVYIAALLLLIGATILFAEVQTVPWVANGVLCAYLALLLLLVLVVLFSRWLWLYTSIGQVGMMNCRKTIGKDDCSG